MAPGSTPTTPDTLTCGLPHGTRPSGGGDDSRKTSVKQLRGCFFLKDDFPGRWVKDVTNIYFLCRMQMMNHHNNLISAMSGFCLVVCWQIHMGSCDNRVTYVDLTLGSGVCTRCHDVNLVFLNFPLNLCCEWWSWWKKSCTNYYSYSEYRAIYINLPGHSVSYIMNWWMVQNINRVVSTPPEIVQPDFPNMNRFISLRRSWLKLEPNTWDAQQTGQQWDQRFEGILVEKCISSGPAPSQ